MNKVCGAGAFLLGGALILYLATLPAGAGEQQIFAAAAVVSLGAAIYFRRWLLLSLWGLAIATFYVRALEGPGRPPPVAAVVIGVAVLVVIELFDRYVLWARAVEEATISGETLGHVLAAVAIGGAASVIVMAAAEILKTDGVAPLAVAGACGLAAAAAIVFSATGRHVDQT
jgi:hypothetical protein